MSHKTVDEMIMSLPRSEQVLVKRLRAKILAKECNYSLVTFEIEG